MNFSKSWMVTRPAAPLPGTPARSAACIPARPCAPSCAETCSWRRWHWLARASRARSVGRSVLRGRPGPGTAWAASAMDSSPFFSVRGCVQAQARGIFRTGLQVSQHRADGITFVELDGKFLDAARAGAGHVHGGLAGLHLDDVLVRADLVADLDQQINDVASAMDSPSCGMMMGMEGMGQRKCGVRSAECGVETGQRPRVLTPHSAFRTPHLRGALFTVGASAGRRRRCARRGPMGRPQDSDGRARGCPWR